MIETVLLKALSESWYLLLFVLTLYWVYKLASSFLNKYLDLQKEHNNDFLNKFWSMVNNIWTLSESVKEWNKNQTLEHKKLIELLECNHWENSEHHEKIIWMIKEVDLSVKTTHSSVELLHEKITKCKNYEASNWK